MRYSALFLSFFLFIFVACDSSKHLSNPRITATSPEESVNPFQVRAEQFSEDFIIPDGHIGFGADLDGVGRVLPNGLEDLGAYSYFIAERLKSGYHEKDLEKICLGIVEDYAKKNED